MVAWRAFCDEHDLFFLEDAAQSLGSFQGGRHLGRYGDVGSFSFSSPKIVTTGQGGALITDDDALAASMRKIKDFGRERGGVDWHDMMGAKFQVHRCPGRAGDRADEEAPLAGESEERNLSALRAASPGCRR
jgi:dTDP-4-amino-4,6-dideoxygalactose transaminase